MSVADPFLAPSEGDRPTPRFGTGRAYVACVGPNALRDLSLGAQRAIEAADALMLLDADPVLRRYVRRVNRGAALLDIDTSHVPPATGQRARISQELRLLDEAKTICILYQTPSPAYRAALVELVRSSIPSGVALTELPGISLEGMIVAGPAFAGARGGLQVYDGLEFVTRRPRFDATFDLVLWGANRTASARSVAGQRGCCNPQLVEVLAESYGAAYDVIVYEFAAYTVCEDVVRRCNIDQLSSMTFGPFSALFVPARPSEPTEGDAKAAP